MPFQQVPELQHRRFIGRTFAAQVDSHEPPHRLGVVQRFLDTRITQRVPLLQEMDAQHPLQPDRAPASAILAHLRIVRLDQRAQR
jgi:hypothetical protein